MCARVSVVGGGRVLKGRRSSTSVRGKGMWCVRAPYSKLHFWSLLLERMGIMHVPFNSRVSFLHPSHPYPASHTLRQIGPLNIAFKTWISPDGCSTLTPDLLILVSH